MKILHVLPSLVLAGAEVFVKNIAIEMVARGHNVTVLIFAECDKHLYDMLVTNGVNIVNFKTKKAYSICNVFLMLLHLRRHHYDVVHAHLTPSQLYLAVVDFVIKMHAILVTTEHSTHNKRRGKKTFRYLDYFIYSRFDKIISISQATQDCLIGWLPRIRNKCVVVNNGIDLNKFNAFGRKVINRTDKKDMTILCVARFEPQKGQDILIRALALTSGLNLVLVGDGSTKETNICLVEELGISDRVVFLGNRLDIPELIATTDIYVQPSIWEGFGIAALEAMAGGAAVIVSDIPGLRDVVGDAGLSFAPGVIKELVHVLTQITVEKGRIEKLSALAVERAKMFSLERTVNKYSEIYENIR